MRKKYWKIVGCALLIFFLGIGMDVDCLKSQAAEYTCVYQHDPRLNETAMKDIVVNPAAVYGFSPDPNSERLGAYADYDWTDPAIVEKARAERINYHLEMQSMYGIWNEMEAAGKSVEEIARAVSAERNRVRIDSYKDNPQGLESLKQSNLSKYGNENGPTAESLFEKYGSWDKVLLKSFSENTGMDACLGLYDIYYPNYIKTENISGNGDYVNYSVVNGDSLYKVAEKYFGDGSKYSRIAKENKIANPYVIFVGQKLVIKY